MPTGLLEDRGARDRGGPESRCGTPRGGDGPGGGGIAGDPARFGLLAFMGTVSMLFIGFTSAYILRRAQADWRPLQVPSLLWFTTTVLLASSGTLEVGRRRFRAWDLRGAQTWVTVTGLLGLAFLVGQVLAWRQLAGQGVFLSSNPHSSFFYVLTGVHGLHLLGGFVWFVAVALRIRRMAEAPGQDGLGRFALYWHFLAGLWLYLLFLLFVF